MPEISNDHNLVMQFARGTTALLLVEELSALEAEFEKRRQAHTDAYNNAMESLYREYYSRTQGVIRAAVARLRELQPGEIESRDDDDDDD